MLTKLSDVSATGRNFGRRENDVVSLKDGWLIPPWWISGHTVEIIGMHQHTSCVNSSCPFMFCSSLFWSLLTKHETVCSEPCLCYYNVVNVNTLASTSLSQLWSYWSVTAAGRVWKVLLDPVSDNRPYTITATLLASPSHVLQLQDVLFGDVWLCVGQNKLYHSVAKVLSPTVAYLNRGFSPKIILSGWFASINQLTLFIIPKLFSVPGASNKLGDWVIDWVRNFSPWASSATQIPQNRNLAQR